MVVHLLMTYFAWPWMTFLSDTCLTFIPSHALILDTSSLKLFQYILWQRLALFLNANSLSRYWWKFYFKTKLRSMRCRQRSISSFLKNLCYTENNSALLVTNKAVYGAYFILVSTVDSTTLFAAFLAWITV